MLRRAGLRDESEWLALVLRLPQSLCDGARRRRERRIREDNVAHTGGHQERQLVRARLEPRDSGGALKLNGPGGFARLGVRPQMTKSASGSDGLEQRSHSRDVLFHSMTPNEEARAVEALRVSKRETIELKRCCAGHGSRRYGQLAGPARARRATSAVSMRASRSSRVDAAFKNSTAGACKKKEPRRNFRFRRGLYWCTRCGSNTRPADQESAALPAELRVPNFALEAPTARG